jgi:hypothetical protein
MEILKFTRGRGRGSFYGVLVALNVCFFDKFEDLLDRRKRMPPFKVGLD